MAIELYDKAEVIKKDDLYYYFLKYGSKNCFTMPFQTIVDNNFNNRFIRGSSRESNWHIIAYGTEKEYNDQKIAETYWNNSTGGIYGRIQFGNGYNIALYLAKKKAVDFYTLSETQQQNIQNEIGYYMKGDGVKYVINLANIPANKKMQTIDDYCGNKTLMSRENTKIYNGRAYWKLNNL